MRQCFRITAICSGSVIINLTASPDRVSDFSAVVPKRAGNSGPQFRYSRIRDSFRFWPLPRIPGFIFSFEEFELGLFRMGVWNFQWELAVPDNYTTYRIGRFPDLNDISRCQFFPCYRNPGNPNRCLRHYASASASASARLSPSNSEDAKKGSQAPLLCLCRIPDTGSRSLMQAHQSPWLLT